MPFSFLMSLGSGKFVWGRSLSLLVMESEGVTPARKRFENIGANMCNLVHFVDEIGPTHSSTEVYMVMGNHTEMCFPRESDGNGDSHMAYKWNGNKTAKKVYKRLYTKLPQNGAVPAWQFTSTSEGDVNHPTLGHKTEFQ